MSTPDNVDGVAKPEVTITSDRNRISVDFLTQHTCFRGRRKKNTICFRGRPRFFENRMELTSGERERLTTLVVVGVRT